MAIFPATVVDNFFHEFLDILTKNRLPTGLDPTAGLTSCTLLTPPAWSCHPPTNGCDSAVKERGLLMCLSCARLCPLCSTWCPQWTSGTVGCISAPIFWTHLWVAQVLFQQSQSSQLHVVWIYPLPSFLPEPCVSPVHCILSWAPLKSKNKIWIPFATLCKDLSLKVKAAPNLPLSPAGNVSALLLYSHVNVRHQKGERIYTSYCSPWFLFCVLIIVLIFLYSQVIPKNKYI